MEARARVVYLWSRRINVSVWFPEWKKREEGGGRAKVLRSIWPRARKSGRRGLLIGSRRTPFS